MAEIPTLTVGAHGPRTRFVYTDGCIYVLESVDEVKQTILLERLGKPGAALGTPAGSLPRLEEAAECYVYDVEGKVRCRFTEEIEERGKFLTAKYVKNAVVHE